MLSTRNDRASWLWLSFHMVNKYLFEGDGAFNVLQEGDTVAYRLIELSPSWTPELSSFRV